MRFPATLRRATDPILERLRVPVASGANRGRWWSLVSAGAGYASGRRSADQLAALQALLVPGDVMWDVGAHHGYMTLVAAAAVAPGGHVYAFEPGAQNRRILENHLRWNDVGNVTVLGVAVGAEDGEATFGGAGTSKTQHIGGGGATISVRSGASLVRSGSCATPTFLKIDVEGAEGAAVEGLIPILAPTARLMIAMHNRDADARASAALAAAGFTLHPSRALLACRAGEWRSDPDLFCAGPAHPRTDADLEALEALGF